MIGLEKCSYWNRDRSGRGHCWELVQSNAWGNWGKDIYFTTCPDCLLHCRPLHLSSKSGRAALPRPPHPREIQANPPHVTPSTTVQQDDADSTSTRKRMCGADRKYTLVERESEWDKARFTRLEAQTESVFSSKWQIKCRLMSLCMAVLFIILFCSLFSVLQAHTHTHTHSCLYTYEML